VLPALLSLAWSSPPIGPARSALPDGEDATSPPALQDETRTADPLWLGLELQAGLLVGDASDFLDGGFGLQGSVRWYAPRRWIAARTAIGFLALSQKRDEVSGITTDNTLVHVLVGPELILPLGPVEPHAFGVVGLAVNLLDTDGPGGGADETDAAFAYGAGGGLRVIVRAGRHPLAVQANAAIVNAGELDFSTLGVEGSSAQEEDIVSLILSVGLSAGLD
jgi:hypothetical protein